MKNEIQRGDMFIAGDQAAVLFGKVRLHLPQNRGEVPPFLFRGKE